MIFAVDIDTLVVPSGDGLALGGDGDMALHALKAAGHMLVLCGLGYADPRPTAARGGNPVVLKHAARWVERLSALRQWKRADLFDLIVEPNEPLPFVDFLISDRALRYGDGLGLSWPDIASRYGEAEVWRRTPISR